MSTSSTPKKAATKSKATKTPTTPVVDISLADVRGEYRVVIERVSPELDGGRFPIKAIPGDVITVEADIFANGHDYVSARLLYQAPHEKHWHERPMHQLENDRWTGSFTVEHVGRYQYTLEAWVNHIGSWQHELDLKVRDGQRVTSELLAGAVLAETMAHRAGIDEGNTPDQIALYQAAKLFRDEAGYDEAITLARSDQFHHWAGLYPERRHPTRYAINLGVEVDRERAGFSTWYCLFPRSAAREEAGGTTPQHGTFKDVEKLLPRLAGMGFDVLYLPPTHPIGTTHRRGKNNSVTCLPGEPGVPYSIGSAEGGHDAIHPELGTVDDLKHLIEICKNYGLEVAMDLAVQCSPDHPWVAEHPEWFKQRPGGSIQYAENPPQKYQGIYSLYFETEDWRNLWLELKRILLVWASWGVKIVRVDNPDTKPFGFWEWIIAEVKKVHPDMLFLSEAFTRPKVMQQLAKVGYAQSYTYYTWRTTKAELTEYMTELTAGEMRYYFRPNLWPTTHDINPYLLQSGHEPQFLIRYFLAATLSSNYGVYGPSFELMEHIPTPGKEEYLNSETHEIKLWDWDKTNKLTYLITLVNRIRRENAALQQTNNLTFCRIDDDQILAYLKATGESTAPADRPGSNRLLIVVNLDAWNRRWGMVQVPIWQLGIDSNQSYTVHDLITGARYTWTGEWNYVELDPYMLPMHLFRIEV